MKNINVTYHITRAGIFPPIFKRYGDAGFDLRCGKHFYLKPGGNCVPCGAKFAIPFGHEGQIRPRSGNSVNGIPAVSVDFFFRKCGVNYMQWAALPEHCAGGSIYDAIEKFIEEHSEVEFYEDELIRIPIKDARVEIGTVDAGYRKEAATIVQFNGRGLYVIPRNARISQMIINELPAVTLAEGEVNEDTERGTNGFGSTGTI